MHNDGRLGELQAAAKDLLPVEQRQPKSVWVCVSVGVSWGLVQEKNEGSV